MYKEFTLSTILSSISVNNAYTCLEFFFILNSLVGFSGTINIIDLKDSGKKCASTQKSRNAYMDGVNMRTMLYLVLYEAVVNLSKQQIRVEENAVLQNSLNFPHAAKSHIPKLEINHL